MSNMTVKNDQQASISYKRIEGKLTRIESPAEKKTIKNTIYEDVALRLSDNHNYKELRRLYRRQVVIGLFITAATVAAAGFIAISPVFSSVTGLVVQFFSKFILIASSNTEEAARWAILFGHMTTFMLIMLTIAFAVIVPVRRYGGFLKKVEGLLHKFFVQSETVLHQYLVDVINNDLSLNELLNDKGADKQLSNFQYLTNKEANELKERQVLMKGDITDGSTRLASVDIKLEIGEDYKELKVIEYDLINA